MANLDPLDPPEEKYKLPIAAWVAWGLYAAARIWRYVSDVAHRDQPTRLLGELVGSLLLASAFAWVAWRLSRRSSFANHAMFFLVFGFLVLGYEGRHYERLRAEAMAREAVRLQEEQKAQDEAAAVRAKEQAFLRNAPPEIAACYEVVRQVGRSAGKGGPQAHETQRLLDNAMKEYLANVSAAEQRYNDILTDLTDHNFMDLRRHASRQERVEVREKLQALQKANAARAHILDADGTELAHHLGDRDLGPEEIERAVRVYRLKFASRGPLLARVRRADDEVAKAFLAFVDFAETYYGQPRTTGANQSVVFSTPAEKEAYRAVLRRLQGANDERQKLGEQLAAIHG